MGRPGPPGTLDIVAELLRRRVVDRYRRLKAPVRPFVRRHWRHPAFAGLASVSRRYLAIHGNDDHDLSVNGEAEIIRRLERLPVRTAVDVGGFEGSWTDLVLAHHPAARVECVEPSPARADELERTYAGDQRVHVHRVALGEEAGEATLHVHRVHPSLTSLVPSDPADTDEVKVRLEHGDELLAQCGIDHLDLLKVDAEGYDLHVLRGFSGAFAAGRVTVVQFEYNTWNIRSRCLLADFYELLEPFGYAVGKVHPDGVDFRPYAFELENWVGPACVAVRRDRTDLLELLGCGGSGG